MNFQRLLRVIGCILLLCLMDTWSRFLTLQRPQVRILNFNMAENRFSRLTCNICCSRTNYRIGPSRFRRVHAVLWCQRLSYSLYKFASILWIQNSTGTPGLKPLVFGLGLH